MNNDMHSVASKLITKEEKFQQTNYDENKENVEPDAAAGTLNAVNTTDEDYQKAHSLEQPKAEATHSKFEAPLVNPLKESKPKVHVRSCLSLTGPRADKTFACDYLHCEKAYTSMKSKRQHMVNIYSTSISQIF